MRSAFRPLSLLLLALLVWGAGAPLVAVTCVPGAPCAGPMASPLLAYAKRAGQLAVPAVPTVSAPDCCERRARESGPAAIPGAKAQGLAVGDAPAAIAHFPSAPRHIWHRVAAELSAASPVPLYTLHSILLI